MNFDDMREVGHSGNIIHKIMKNNSQMVKRFRVQMFSVVVM